MNLGDFDYELPEELIAQEPAEPRDHSRLMIVNRESGEILHEHFFNLTKYLKPDDLMVFNDTKVTPVRLFGEKDTGGKIEVLLLKEIEQGWEFIGKNIGRAKTLIFKDGVKMKVEKNQLITDLDKVQRKRFLDTFGYTPLPPYIQPQIESQEPNIRRRYQTVYARVEGSAAAPTAGFHFTDELLSKIPNKAFVTLHVGLGTFLPVKESIIENHVMHKETYLIPSSTKSEILNSKQKSGRIVAVGTTTVRTLESFANTGKRSGETDIFIYPGYEFKLVDAMITNFHLPKSTLLMLVSAFAGRELIMKAYKEAILEKYRFFSFGDAMLII